MAPAPSWVLRQLLKALEHASFCVDRLLANVLTKKMYRNFYFRFHLGNSKESFPDEKNTEAYQAPEIGTSDFDFDFDVWHKILEEQ